MSSWLVTPSLTAPQQIVTRSGATTMSRDIMPSLGLQQGPAWRSKLSGAVYSTFWGGYCMDSEAYPVLPLLLRHARPAPTRPAYSYDQEMEVNVLTDADGNVRPVVEGPDAGAVAKTVAVQGEE
jgi:hypothetical protein